jgi:threonine dehydrogenase-like Zn-dependent dehydrogenase
MWTATLAEPGRFEFAERDAPEPDAGQVLLRVAGCGVCASNLGPWTGAPGNAYPFAAGAPGHEVYGRIEQVGAGVTGLAAGQPVVALSYHGFAQLDVAAADAVVPLPPDLADRRLLGEPLACAVNVHRRAGIASGDVVVIVGVGFLGALLVRLARAAGAARVLAVSRREQSLAVAADMGAHAAFRYDEDVVGIVARETGGRMADVVIECTGHQAPLDLAAELTRVRGRMVVAGYHQDGPRTIPMQLWNWRGLDVINAHERDPAVYVSGMAEGVRLVRAGVLDPDPLVTHEFALESINDAFRAAAARPAGFIKAVVTAW